ncbi:sugar ABC transporter permease [Nocardioides carbamazepini]|uniref:carbohydrate ABC transporter permease n=1 Tax=Nocardioides carbamazepini TaxID=2854259 RepID=UPI00214A7D06|nr:sugar ABC transporter permease [Nocardioides carbamazepini]MCR1782364.1 sugar ABC transporter permease [Nocardioides carbamazepini]
MSGVADAPDRSPGEDELQTRPRRSWRPPYFVLLMLAPTVVMFVFFVVLPVLQAVWLSFFDAAPGSRTWVGLDNYRTLAGDPIFRKALTNTVLFTVVVVTFQITLALVIAAMLRPLSARVAAPLRAIYYLPLVVSVIIQAMVWKWIFNPNAYGFANSVLSGLGIDRQDWLASPSQAMATLILSTILVLPGGGVVMYSAAMSGLPQELYEAASVDGAGPIRTFFAVTWPLLKPVTLYLSVIYTIQAFQLFERVYIMTNGGGPGYATMTLAQYTYVAGLQYREYGKASAIAMVLFALAATFTALQFRLLKSDHEY